MSGALNSDPGPTQFEAGFGFDGGFWMESSASVTALANGGITGAPIIGAMINYVTPANDADSVLLPPAIRTGLSLCLTNTSTTKYVQVFAQGSDTVNNIAGATGIPQMAYSQVWYTCQQAGKWVAQGVGSGQSGANQTYSFKDGLTASTTQSQSGTPITTSIARFTTVATPGNAGVLPPSAPGLIFTVINAGANIMTIWPASAAQGGIAGGDQINALGQNIAFALPAGSVCEFFCTALGTWHSLLSANTTQYAYNTDSHTSGFTATGANITGGSAEVTLNLTGTLGGDSNIQLPNAGALISAMTVAGLNPAPGLTYELNIYNSSSANHVWTVTNSANASWTINGTPTIAQNTFRKFYLTITSIASPAVTLQSLGQFTIGSGI